MLPFGTASQMGPFNGYLLNKGSGNNRSPSVCVVGRRDKGLTEVGGTSELDNSPASFPSFLSSHSVEKQARVLRISDSISTPGPPGCLLRFMLFGWLVTFAFIGRVSVAVKSQVTEPLNIDREASTELRSPKSWSYPHDSPHTAFILFLRSGAASL